LLARQTDTYLIAAHTRIGSSKCLASHSAREYAFLIDQLNIAHNFLALFRYGKVWE